MKTRIGPVLNSSGYYKFYKIYSKLRKRKNVPKQEVVKLMTN